MSICQGKTFRILSGGSMLIHTYVRKSIPFVFYSTSANNKSVYEAYTAKDCPGFFSKTTTYGDMKKQIKIIVDYWKECKASKFKIEKR
jgi:hypothetical protein